MKKLLGIMAISALAVSAFAQGTVGFANVGSEAVTQWTSSADTTLINVPKGGGFVELLTAPAGTAFDPLGSLSGAGFNLNFGSMSAFLAANSGWQAISTVGFTTPSAGQFNGGNVPLAGIVGGSTAEYVIIGWTGGSANLDVALAANAFIGSSPMLTTATGNDPSQTPPSTATPLKTTFGGFTMAPVPEPTSFALAGLGLAALLVFRRRS